MHLKNCLVSKAIALNLAYNVLEVILLVSSNTCFDKFVCVAFVGKNKKQF